MKLYTDLPPTHYTEREGGEWIPWPSAMTFDKRLLYCHCDIIEALKFRGLTIHSLRWASKAWDCLHGFRELGHDVPQYVD